MAKVTIKAVGERGGFIIHYFISESEAMAYILGFKDAIHTPSGGNWKIKLDGKEV